MIWARLQGFGYFTLFVMLTLCPQVSCTRRNRSAEVKATANQNGGSNAVTEDSRRGELQLDLKAGRAELGPDECTDLLLDIDNRTSSAFHWRGVWRLEQEGPSPAVPDGIGGTVDIPRGRSTDYVTIRVCGNGRAPGTYRFRVTAVPKPIIPMESNWIEIEILP